MTTAFSLGYTGSKYSNTAAMEQEGLKNLRVPWTTAVVPSIFENTETSSDILAGGKNVAELDAAARDANEARLSLQELQAKYPQVTFQAPQYAATAEYMAQRQSRLQDLEWIKQHSTVRIPGSKFMPEMVSYFAKSFSDPIEMGIMAGTAMLTAGAGMVFPKLAQFTGAGIAHKIAGISLPKATQFAELSAAHLPLSARLAGRFTEGFIENAAGAAVIEPWIADASRRVGDDYHAMNSVMNVFMGGLIGGTIHTGLKTLADPFTRLATKDKFKAMADYIATREAGGDGITALAQNTLPISSLSARDVVNYKGISIIKTADGQFQAHYKAETGLLKANKGIIGRTPAEAIRKLQYSYATAMNDPVLFNELNKLYGTIESANKQNIPNPFIGTGKLTQLKNGSIIRKGGTKYKLSFDSPIDRIFHNIYHILNTKKNQGKSFANISEHKDLLEHYVKWIVDNLGDTTEAEIIKQANNLHNAVTKAAAANRANKDIIRISPYIDISALDAQPGFLTKEQWVERLKSQRDILLGDDVNAALGLLEQIYAADKELQKIKIDRLKESSRNIQKLINLTKEKIENLSERERAKRDFIDSIKATGANVTPKQLRHLMYMMDIVTGDFLAWIEDNHVKYVGENEFKSTRNLKQTVIKKPKENIREKIIKDGTDALPFYQRHKYDIEADNLTLTNATIDKETVDLLVEIKNGKYGLQRALYKVTKNSSEAMTPLEEYKVEKLDDLVHQSYLKKDITLYRGLPQKGAAALIQGDVKPGMTIQAPGYLSGSTLDMVATGFALTEKDSVFLKIKLKKGTPALDIESTLAQNIDFKNDYGFDIHAASDMETLQDLYPDRISDDLGFVLSDGLESEILLPRDIALKVIAVEDSYNGKIITVTPDEKLNALYGDNFTRENVDILFQQVEQNKIQVFQQLEQFEPGSPEHALVAKDAFYNGIALPQDVIDLYPELQSAQRIAKSVPGTWLLQAVHKNAAANRIVGEFTKDIPFKQFVDKIGYTYVYNLGDGTYTKFPGEAIRKTGKAELYDLGDAIPYEITLDSRYDGIAFDKDVLAWEPRAEKFLADDSEARILFIHKLAKNIKTLKNAKGITFLDYLDSLNLTSRGKVKKVPDYFRVNINEGTLVYTLKNQPFEAKSLGEPTLFKGMSPEEANAVLPETVYEALIGDEINKVEIKQNEVLEATAKKKELEKEVAEAKTIEVVEEEPEVTTAPEPEVTTAPEPEVTTAPEPEVTTAPEKPKKRKKKVITVNSNGVQVSELVKEIKEYAKEAETAKNEVKKAKKKRTKKLEAVNKKSEPQNQIIKGAVDVSSDSQYIVGLFKNADISTLIHETAHVFRRTVLDEDMLETAEHALGVKNGKWTVEAEEKFARGFEKYLTEDMPPSPGLKGLFKAFKSWLTKIYINLTQSPMQEELSPELRSVFDRLFAEERVKMAEEAGFKNADMTLNMYRKALTQHQEDLVHINKSIRQLEAENNKALIPDGATYQKIKQDKLTRIQSQLDLMKTPAELNEQQIQDKMQESSNILNRAAEEYNQVVESQLEKNKKIESDLMTYYVNELALDEEGLRTYTKNLGIDEAQLHEMLNDETLPEELRYDNIEQEAEKLTLVEGALNEFGNCTRGEI